MINSVVLRRPIVLRAGVIPFTSKTEIVMTMISDRHTQRRAPRERQPHPAPAETSSAPESRAADVPAASSSPSQRLQKQFAAVRVSFTWLGVRKSLSTQ